MGRSRHHARRKMSVFLFLPARAIRPGARRSPRRRRGCHGVTRAVIRVAGSNHHPARRHGRGAPDAGLNQSAAGALRTNARVPRERDRPCRRRVRGRRRDAGGRRRAGPPPGGPAERARRQGVEGSAASPRQPQCSTLSMLAPDIQRSGASLFGRSLVFPARRPDRLLFVAGSSSSSPPAPGPSHVPPPSFPPAQSSWLRQSTAPRVAWIGVTVLRYP